MSKHIVMIGYRHCITCELDKLESEFYRYKYTTNGGNPGMRYDSRCKVCARKRRIDQYKSKEGRIKAKRSYKIWYEKNKEEQKAYRKMRQKDPGHRANKAKAQRLRKARMRSGSDNNDPAIAAIYQLAMDTEKKLAACVECDDELEIKMHVDHKEPLCLGGKHIASNLQVISARANLKKGSRPASALPKEVGP